MSETGKPRWYQRTAADFSGAWEFVGCCRRLRKIKAELPELKGKFAERCMELGSAVFEAGLCRERPEFMAVTEAAGADDTARRRHGELAGALAAAKKEEDDARTLHLAAIAECEKVHGEDSMHHEECLERLQETRRHLESAEKMAARLADKRRAAEENAARPLPAPVPQGTVDKVTRERMSAQYQTAKVAVEKAVALSRELTQQIGHKEQELAAFHEAIPGLEQQTAAAAARSQESGTLLREALELWNRTERDLQKRTAVADQMFREVEAVQQEAAAELAAARLALGQTVLSGEADYTQVAAQRAAAETAQRALAEAGGRLTSVAESQAGLKVHFWRACVWSALGILLVAAAVWGVVAWNMYPENLRSAPSLVAAAEDVDAASNTDKPLSDPEIEHDFPPLVMTVISEKPVQPLAIEQTVDFGGNITLTIPGDTLKASAAARLAKVESSLEANVPELALGEVYDISVGRQHEFSSPLEVTLPYDVQKVPSPYPAEVCVTVCMLDPYTRIWMQLPATVDSASQTIKAQTRHLSTLTVVYWMGEEDCKIIADGDFIVYYNRKEVMQKQDTSFESSAATASGVLREPIPNPREGSGSKVSDAITLSNLFARIPPSEMKQVPGFVVETILSAQQAIRAYRQRGFELYTKPLHIYITAAGSSQHNSITNNVTVTMSTGSPQELRYVVAHEMFHNIQANHYYVAGIMARRWWMEVTAEYAASRIAVPNYVWMGKRNESLLPPKYLQQYLTYYSTPKSALWKGVSQWIWGDDPYHYHGYHGAYFIDYLCRTGTALLRGKEPELTEGQYFARLYRSVASTHGTTLGALDDFLSSQLGVDESGQCHCLQCEYPRFAMWFLFDPGSPLKPAKGDSDPLESAAELSVVVAPGLTVPLKHTFELTGGYTAKLWTLKPQIKDKDNIRTFRVSVEGDVPAGCSVQVVHLPGGRRQTDVQPVGMLEGAQGKTAGGEPSGITVTVNQGDTFCIVAANTDAGDQSVTVKVTEQPGIFPLCMVDMEMVHKYAVSGSNQAAGQTFDSRYDFRHEINNAQWRGDTLSSSFKAADGLDDSLAITLGPNNATLAKVTIGRKNTRRDQSGRLEFAWAKVPRSYTLDLGPDGPVAHIFFISGPKLRELNNSAVNEASGTAQEYNATSGKAETVTFSSKLTEVDWNASYLMVMVASMTDNEIQAGIAAGTLKADELEKRYHREVARFKKEIQQQIEACRRARQR